DGKPLKYHPHPVSSSSRLKDKRPAVENDNGQPTAGTNSSQSAKRQNQGKLVFGSNANRPKDTQQV
ncbi:hypothetical protein RF074_20350, partial [Serratia marcescens]|uniref:hypothetical protein n=1 Tax=Serratia marcescens TaxID=615 RepID=UPI00281453AF